MLKYATFSSGIDAFYIEHQYDEQHTSHIIMSSGLIDYCEIFHICWRTQEKTSRLACNKMENVERKGPGTIRINVPYDDKRHCLDF
jgi:hypothetical protein